MLVNEAKSQNWKKQKQNTRVKFFQYRFFWEYEKKNAMHKETTRKLNFGEKIFERVLGK